MTRSGQTAWSLVIGIGVLGATAAWLQANQKDLVRKHFADREQQALAQPFVGVRTGDGIRPGLYTIEATGVSTAGMVSSAGVFLDSLDKEQNARVRFAIDDIEWRKWSNVDNGIYDRQGVSLKEMNDNQRTAAWSLLEQALSPQGVELSRNIMKTDQTLAEINNNPQDLDELLYFLTVMGQPSANDPWGWQLDGHHLIINNFVLGDQLVMSPVFLGGEPVHTTSGKYAGNVILQQEQDLGLALMNSLSPQQRAEAVLREVKDSNDMQAAANSDNAILDYQGTAVSRFSRQQQADLLELIALYVGNMNTGHAQVRMQEVSKHLDETWFAWAGNTQDDAVFYYRIHSPVLLIEFDHQNPVGTRAFNTAGQPTRDHIHIMMRTPNGNDYGKDLLRQHLQQHPH